MVAIVDQSDQRFWVYFVDTQGCVRLYKGPEQGQKENARGQTPYSGPLSITFDGDENRLVRANPQSPKIAVCDYVPKDGTWEAR
jgi:hypothetical protein